MDAAAIARAGCAAFGVADAPQLVRHGENTTFRAGAWAVRVHRPGYRSAVEVRSEIAWMEALRTEGVATPTAARTADGSPVVAVSTPDGERHVSLLSWEAGAPLDDDGDPAPWRLVGGLMARLHLHGATWRRPPWFTRWSWDADGMVGDAPHWGDPAALGTWDDATRDLLHAARDRVRARLDAFGTAPERYGLVHGDLAFANVLRDRERLTLIDFDDAGWSWYLWELAVVLAPVDGTPAYAPRRDALVAGYRAVRPLPDEDLAELPTFVMARRLATLGWVFTHAETEHAATLREWRIASFPDAARRYLAV